MMEHGDELKITLLVRYFTIGGLERVVIALANEFVSRGYDTQIVIISRGKRNSLITELDPRIEIVFLDGSPLLKGLKLRKITKGRLVHINFGDGKIHPWIRAHLVGEQKTITYHSVYRHKRNFVLNKFDYMINCRLPAIVAVSDAVKHFCCADVGLAPEKVFVIKNGIKFESLKTQRCYRNDRIEILVLCSMYPHKNHKEIIEHFSTMLMEGIDNWHLTFIGDGPCMSELFIEAKNNDLLDKITWLGAVWNRELINSVFTRMDILLSASTFEGLPISILEAMRYHMPLWLSDIPPHREIGGDAAYYFTLGSYDSFKSTYLKINEEYVLLSNRGDLAFERMKHFNLDNTVDDYLMVYQTIWKKRKKKNDRDESHIVKE